MSELREKYGVIVGTTDNTPKDASTVSGDAGKNRIQTGGEHGESITSYQRLFGGDGSDTFNLRAKDFSAETANTTTKYIADFYGAAGTGPDKWNQTSNDFIQFTGFEKGAHLSGVIRSVEGTVPDSTTDVIYQYHILGAENQVLGTFNVQSINGKTLGQGDYAFY